MHQNHTPEFDESIPTDLPRVRTWAVALAALLAIASFAGLFYLGWAPRQHRLARLDEDLAHTTESRPVVELARPKPTDPTIDLRLPADSRPNQETAIYPRATGYLKHLLVDIGDRVKPGQLLAEIDIPDLDAQLVEARAAVTQAKANIAKAQADADLAELTAKRFEALGPDGGVSQQQVDERRAAATQARSAVDAFRAAVAAADATLQRLTTLQAFANVTAPFAGVITARNFDVGALMSATNPAATGREIFRLADTDTLRVFVNVPQPYVSAIPVGTPVQLSVRNHPGRLFDGTVARSAGTLDPTTRTLRFEITVPNKSGDLFAGMYAEAHIRVTTSAAPGALTIPTSALVFDAAGTRVWTVGPDNKAHAKPVTVGRDFGTEIEIPSGLSPSDQIVTNPGTHLTDGAEVLASNTLTPTPADPKQAAAR